MYTRDQEKEKKPTPKGIDSYRSVLYHFEAN